MQNDKQLFDPRAAITAAGMLVIIVYGSLYPFRFDGNSLSTEPLHYLLSSWKVLTRPGDVLANVLFYLPLGFFFARSLKRLPFWATVMLATTAGVLLSVLMESAQFYINGRHSAMSDVYADAVGSLLGALTGCLTRGWTGPRSKGFRDHFAMLLIVSWLGGRLYPYVPVIDLHKYWDALKPLVFSPVLPAVDVYRHAVTWLAVALLLEVLVGIARSRILLFLLFPAVVSARVLIGEIVLSPAEIVGGMIGVTAWIAALSRLDHRAGLITGLFAGSIVLQALEPFRFLPAPRAFGWIPFRSFMRGSIETAVVSFLEKVFSYGGLVWLLTRSGYSWVRATAWSASLILLLRLLQVYLPGRSAEITDVIILLIVAGMMRLMPESESDLPRNKKMGGDLAADYADYTD